MLSFRKPKSAHSKGRSLSLDDEEVVSPFAVDLRTIDVSFDSISDEYKQVKDYLKNYAISLQTLREYEPPKALLLYGPRGVGKTLLAKAIATRAQLPLFDAEKVMKRRQENAFRLFPEQLKCLFEHAHARAPSLKLFRAKYHTARRHSTLGLEKPMLQQLLISLSKRRGHVALLATACDYSLVRSFSSLARVFNQYVEVPFPNNNLCGAFIEQYMKKKAPNNDLNPLMNSTEIVGGTLRSDLRWDVSVISPPATPRRAIETPLNSTLAPRGTPLKDITIEVSAIKVTGRPRENLSHTIDTTVLTPEGSFWSSTLLVEPAAAVDVVAWSQVLSTGSEVEEIIDYAAMLAVTSAEGFGINNAHMLAAYKLQALTPLTSVIDTKPDRQRRAYHDAGHALAALLTPGGPQVDEVTLEAHRKSRHGFASSDIISQPMRILVDIDIAGVVAERLVFGDVERGSATVDADMAYAHAHKMLSGVDIRPGEIDRRAAHVVTASAERMRNILEKHRVKLDVLCKALCKRLTLSGDQIKKILR